MNYSKEVELAIKKSKEIAIQIKSKTIRPEHLFLGLIDDEESISYQIIRDLNLNIQAISQTLKDWSSAIQTQIGEAKLRSNSVISLDIVTDDILKKSMTYAKSFNSDQVYGGHVFYAILHNENNLVTELFSKSPDTMKLLKSKLKSTNSLLILLYPLIQRQ